MKANLNQLYDLYSPEELLEMLESLQLVLEISYDGMTLSISNVFQLQNFLDDIEELLLSQGGP